MDEETQLKRKSSGIAKTAFILSLVLLVVAGGAITMLWFSYTNLDDRYNELVGYYYFLKNQYEDGGWEPRRFSIPAEGYGPINSQFVAADIDAEQHLTGYRITGVIINTSSVAHSQLKFRIYTHDPDAEWQRMPFGTEFSIHGELKPGRSQEFDVYVPDIEVNELKEVQITYETSYMKWTPQN